MNIKRHIEELSLKDFSQRKDALIRVLSSEGIHFSRESSRDIENFIFESNGSIDKNYLFTAHYDNFRGSSGANDNMSSICILIDLYREFNARNIRSNFAFLDGEEYNHKGAAFFVQNHPASKYAGIINLDMCGYGDSIVLNGKLHSFTAQRLLKKHNAELVKFLPESDDVIFHKHNPRTLNIAIVPKWDVQYLKALAAFGDGLLGRPPEFYMILSQMEISQTLHNAPKDSPEFVDELAMKKVFDFLLDAVSSDCEHKQFSLSKLLREFRDNINNCLKHLLEAVSSELRDCTST